MNKQLHDRIDDTARWLQRLGVGLSALLGGLVGLSFATNAAQAWVFAFGGFLSLLWIGMTVVVLSAISERVPGGAVREGLYLSFQVFFGQVTIYAGALLALALTPLAVVSMPVLQLALAMLPGLYLCSVMAILGSGPIYLRLFPARHDR
jgi:hypothetical protein